MFDTARRDIFKACLVSCKWVFSGKVQLRDLHYRALSEANKG
jgi:hypothetical protein